MVKNISDRVGCTCLKDTRKHDAVALETCFMC